ncbi:hypothetical protein DU002_11575 [Corallincola holothuriorum]|uniref:Uncharacterized protein n=1 Tax=Corallincola holothuriorum TaxID=2282215 RepID=A0A368NHF4_9GAMM|nr:hypothetical protein DU002_11575 [Corallincola holothuriorum]
MSIVKIAQVLSRIRESQGSSKHHSLVLQRYQTLFIDITVADAIRLQKLDFGQGCSLWASL